MKRKISRIAGSLNMIVAARPTGRKSPERPALSSEQVKAKRLSGQQWMPWGWMAKTRVSPRSIAAAAAGDVVTVVGKYRMHEA
eukprot:CAMPEP_0197410188 /NCGR_PEP_ID=MMETSP1165-20131217/31009_1 /TAXON_ID=284809 /ORGANISM="Chrysocystis fragilis, Strain CCMP3189" /LENGTH=82 /DNA_ID=CAMNT_0042936683 /DNA_START=12 /DNA_END=256 /DNA_ORIENTATION=+